MASEVVIKISGDIDDYTNKLEEAERVTQGLSDKLGDIATVAGVAFAALTAEIALSVKSFAESEAAANQLKLAIENQGLSVEELTNEYKSYAEAVQEVTGLDDDAIITAQATLQARIGQTKITKDLTFAIADLAEAQKIDLDSAAQLVAKGINGQTAALKKLGIEIDSGLSKQERLIAIQEQIAQKFGGTAEAANKGLGGIRGLQTAFGNLQEAIGERFAPIVTVAIQKITAFISAASKNKSLIDTAVSVIGVGTALTGLITAAALAGSAFIKISAILQAFGIVMSATKVAAIGLAGATGIGLLIVVVSQLAANWNTVFPIMKANFAAFVAQVSALGSGLAKVLGGIFTLNPELIKKGLDEARNFLIEGSKAYNEEFKKSQEEQVTIVDENEKKKLEAKRKAAERAEAQRQEQEQRELDAQKSANEEKQLAADGYSKQTIELKKQETEALKLIADEAYEGDKEALLQRSEELRTMRAEQMAIDNEQKAVFQEEILANNEEYNAMTQEQQALFREQHNAELQNQLLTEKSVNQEAARIRAQEQVKSNNQFLLEQKKFGTAYAYINQVMHSEIYRGSKQAFGELAQLQQSENARLKQIGKVAALASIVIKTAESAMNIYAGFSTIPIVGPVLGIAGAAAAIAFGAEQFQKVNAAAEGGLLTGGIPGVDSIPVLAQQGELVAPAQNFEEVIGSVRAQREAENLTGGNLGGSQNVNVMIGFDGREASQVITARQIEDRALGISPETVT